MVRAVNGASALLTLGQGDPVREFLSSILVRYTGPGGVDSECLIFSTAPIGLFLGSESPVGQRAALATIFSLLGSELLTVQVESLVGTLWSADDGAPVTRLHLVA